MTTERLSPGRRGIPNYIHVIRLISMELEAWFMARIRSIKPGFFRSEDVSALPFRARLTWIGLWTQCDDEGRTKDNVRLIKADIWPLDDVSLRDVEEDLETLAAHGRIVRYEVDGRRYLAIVNWHDHQAIPKPTPAKYPPPPWELPNDSGSPPVVLPEDAGRTTARKGEERKGREGTRAGAREPPTRCAKHLTIDLPPPCGACADARRNHKRWERDTTGSPRCERHRGQPADNCALCRSENLGVA